MNNDNSDPCILDERFLERMAQTMPGILFVYDTVERKNIYANRAIEDYLGYTVEQIQAIPNLAEEIVHPEDHAAWESYVAGFETLADGEIRESEYRVRHANGSYRWLNFRCSVFARSAAGKVCQITGVALDVTDKKNADDALARSMNRYRILFDRIDEGFCVIEMLFDEEGKPRDYLFLEINPAFIHQTGLDQAVGKTMREMIPGHEEHWFEIYGKVALTGEPIRFENWAEGMKRWFDVYAFRYGGPESRRVAVLFKDSTARRKMEEALRESESQYRALFNSIDEGFCVLEVIFDERSEPLDYRWLETNPAFERHTGLKDAVGKTARQLVPDLDESWFRIYGRVASTGEAARFENHAPAMNRSFSVYAFRIGDPAERKVALLFRDITAQKKAEEDLRLYAEELKRSNQELEHFANIASHDLQEPLRTVTSYSDYLTETFKESLGEDERQAIAAIQTGARRAHQLTVELLEYAKIGRDKKKFTRVPLDRVLQDVLTDLKMSVLKKQADITYDHLPGVFGDEMQLKQLFQNLVSNSLKYSKLRVRVLIRAERKGGEWVFSVKDDGIGIDLRYVDRIFQIFQRLHPQSEYEGTGIGLAICKKIVEGHGGRIWVNSMLNKGSTFYFSLPVLSPEKRKS